MSQPPQKEANKPLRCIFCTSPLIKAGTKIVCPYCSIIISTEGFKSLEAILFTNKEKEELQNKQKAELKRLHIEDTKQARKEKK